jgi:hypothetical protein
MTTKILGLDYFKTNINRLWKEGLHTKTQYLITVHSKPVRKVTPASSELEDTDLEYYKHPGFYKVDETMDDFLAYLEKCN